MAGSKRKQPKQFFYAVQSGRKTGIFNSYDEVRPLVDGFNGAVQKKFTTRTAAEAFLKQSGYGPRKTTKVEKPTRVVPVRIGGIRVIGGIEGCAGMLIPIYTDGASRNNQSPNARAGYGIFFGEGHKDNVSKRLPGLPQTNQRAELTAIYEACKIIRDRDDGNCYDIRTDSQYSISCLKEWCLKWKENGWKNSAGEKVSNRDLIEPAMILLNSLGDRVRLTKVKGHSGDPGNDAADALAVRGAEMV